METSAFRSTLKQELSPTLDPWGEKFYPAMFEITGVIPEPI